ncbi:MAG: DMT family transporter [Candidatus Lokiarchaeota archaeon]|nr:DMT family transporter [Candidatus Lokiarchaeota archaeon]
MSNYNFKKGITFGSIGVFLIGLQPVISIARPSIIDPFMFATMTALVEALIFLPLYLIERRRLFQNKNNAFDLQIRDSLLNGWKKKKNLNLLITIGLIFSVVPILLYIGFDIAGAINSSLTLKSEIIFALVFGVIFLKEKRISKIQIIFCIVLFLGLLLAISEGSFNLIEFNMGVMILIICVVLFTFFHTFTKSGFDRNEIFPTQVVFIRNLMSGIILFILYIIIFPIENLLLILDFENYIFFILMGVDYGFSLFLWYKTLTYIEIGKASIINSLTPIVSAFFAWLILGDIFTVFHLFGTLIIIFSIFIIVREEKD